MELSCAKGLVAELVHAGADLTDSLVLGTSHHARAGGRTHLRAGRPKGAVHGGTERRGMQVTDQQVKLEYLKLLLDRRHRCGEAFARTVRQFFLFALAFFVLTRFQPSELELFGATVSIPQEWLVAIAPLVLAFLQYRSGSLREAHLSYRRMVDAVALEALSGQEWKADEQHVRAINQSVFWYSVLPAIRREQQSSLYSIAHFTLSSGFFVGTELVPALIVGYFVWLLWQEQNITVSLAVSIPAIGMVCLSVIQRIYLYMTALLGGPRRELRDMLDTITLMGRHQGPKL